MKRIHNLKMTAPLFGLTVPELRMRVLSGDPVWQPDCDLNPGGLYRKWGWTERRITEIQRTLTLLYGEKKAALRVDPSPTR